MQSKPRRFAKHPATNFAWLLSERLTRLILGLATSVAVARYLGPVEFGRLGYATAFQSIFLVVAGLGLDDVLARALVANGSNNSLAAIWRLRVLGSGIALLATLCSAWIWHPGDFQTWTLVALASTGLLFAPWDAIPVWYQVKENMGPPAIARLTAFVASVAFRFGLIALEASLITFAVAITLEALLRAAALAWVFRGEPTSWFRGTFSPRQLASLLVHGAPLLFSGLLVILTMQADRLLLLRWRGELEAGIFVAGARLTETLYTLPILLNTVLMPRFLHIYSENRSLYWRFARSTGFGLIATSVAIAFACTLIATSVVPVLFGPQYASAAKVFGIHVWSLVFVCIVSLRSRLLVVSGANQWVLLISLFTTSISLLGNTWMIPRYGATGAAWTSVIAWCTSALILPWFFPVPRKFMISWLGAQDRIDMAN